MDSERNRELLDTLLSKDRDKIARILDRKYIEPATKYAYFHGLDDPPMAASLALDFTLEKALKIDWSAIADPNWYIVRMYKNHIKRQREQQKAQTRPLGGADLTELAGLPQPKGEESGFRSVTPKEDKRVKRSHTGQEIKHRWARALVNYFSVTPDSVMLDDEESIKWVKFGKRRYIDTKKAVESIKGDIPRQRITKLLQGYSQTEIANQEGVKRQSVNETILSQLAEWEWDAQELSQRTIYWQFFGLVKIGRKTKQEDFLDTARTHPDTTKKFHDLDEDSAVPLWDVIKAIERYYLE